MKLVNNKEGSGKTPEELQLSEAPIGGLLLKFSLPTVVSLLATALYNIVDQVYIGWGVGYLGNAATNVTFPLVSITMALSLLIGNGCAANFSLSLGQGDKERAAQYVGNALALQSGVGLALAILATIFLEPLLMLFGTTDKVMAYALSYGRIILLGTPMVMVTMGLSNIIRADSSPRYAMWSSLLGAIMNVVLDPIFIFSWGLDMGVAGAAWATVISQVASFLISVAYIKKFRCIALAKRHLALRWSVVRPIATLGASSLLNHTTLTVIQIVVNNSLAYYGAQSHYGAEIPLSALGIVMKVNQIMMSLLVGIAIGGQPITGYNYGAGNFHRVRQVYFASVTMATVCAFGAFLVFQFAPDLIIGVFGHENDLYNDFARLCFRIYLFMVPLMGFQTVTAVYFQATGRPGKSIVLTLIQRLGFMVPACLILPLFWGLRGLLFSAPVADSLAMVVTVCYILPELKRLRSMEQGLSA